MAAKTFRTDGFIPLSTGQAGWPAAPDPAMMAGITNRLWKFDDLFNEVKSRYL